jgi:hypothetical protein
MIDADTLYGPFVYARGQRPYLSLIHDVVIDIHSAEERSKTFYGECLIFANWSGAWVFVI